MNLRDDDLEQVTGGAAKMTAKSTTLYTCKECGSPVTPGEWTRIEGGLTGTYICTNARCKTKGRTLYNDEVNAVTV